MASSLYKTYLIVSAPDYNREILSGTHGFPFVGVMMADSICTRSDSPMRNSKLPKKHKNSA
jgi:hypothetical protein